jgi:hypothetical protein
MLEYDDMTVPVLSGWLAVSCLFDWRAVVEAAQQRRAANPALADWLLGRPEAVTAHVQVRCACRLVPFAARQGPWTSCGRSFPFALTALLLHLLPQEQRE